jgi:hypothetical protein
MSHVSPGSACSTVPKVRPPVRYEFRSPGQPPETPDGSESMSAGWPALYVFVFSDCSWQSSSCVPYVSASWKVFVAPDDAAMSAFEWTRPWMTLPLPLTSACLWFDASQFVSFDFGSLPKDAFAKTKKSSASWLKAETGKNRAPTTTARPTTDTKAVRRRCVLARQRFPVFPVPISTVSLRCSKTRPDLRLSPTSDRQLGPGPSYSRVGLYDASGLP